jgi:hypothetical protein
MRNILKKLNIHTKFHCESVKGTGCVAFPVLDENVTINVMKWAYRITIPVAFLSVQYFSSFAISVLLMEGTGQ